MKFAAANHYYQQIKLLHFGQKYNRDKGAGYEREFKSTSTCVADTTKRS